MELKPDILISVVRTKMPYGKYKDFYVTDLPEHYLVWLSQKGFPKGKLGEALAVMYEVRLNGLMSVLYPIIKEYR